MFQYSRSKSMVPTAMPPMSAASPRWPAMAVSTMPTSGTVMLARMLGTASRTTSRLMGLRSAI